MTDATKPNISCDEELPGTWEQADLIGGETDMDNTQNSVLRGFWFHRHHSWGWDTAKYNRVNFPQDEKYRWWQDNWFWSVGCDEHWRRTLVIHLPLGYGLVAVTSRQHPEWEHEDD